MKTVHLLRAGFGFTALVVAAVGGLSIWGNVKAIEESAQQETRGVATVVTYFVMRHPDDNPLTADQSAIQADVLALHALYGRDIEVVDRNMRIVADVVPADVGTLNPQDEVVQVMAEGTPRATVEITALGQTLGREGRLVEAAALLARLEPEMARLRDAAAEVIASGTPA